ncbi:P-type DNA transfer protein VirB5 [Pseudomonas kitaguniensis]|uniref:P-type DNA transfer protein VirB5 n=1 Tax=Pseudomonas kitaguniensis TaxID=2607908 RepID=UPI003B9E7EE7
MKMQIAALAAAVVLGAALSNTVFALGVPTLDATTGLILTNSAIAQASQAANALKTAKDGIEQVRDQYNNYKSIVTGNDKLGNFLSNPSINKVLPLGEWSQLYSDVKDIASLRERYGLKSENQSVQARFDRVLSAMDALEKTYDASTERVKNAELLRAKLNEVQTPQQKEDLQLRFQQEYLEVQNQQMRLANMKMLQEQQDKIVNQQRAQAFEDYMFGRNKNLPAAN